MSCPLVTADRRLLERVTHLPWVLSVETAAAGSAWSKAGAILARSARDRPDR